MLCCSSGDSFSDCMYSLFRDRRGEASPRVVVTEASGDHQLAPHLVDSWLFPELHSEGHCFCDHLSTALVSSLDLSSALL